MHNSIYIIDIVTLRKVGIDMRTFQIEDATNEEQNYIDSHLVDFNNTKVPFMQDPPFLSINKCIRDSGKVVGGILAQIYCWNILYIDVLWVQNEHRNNGYASALVSDIENTARKMGCKICHLDTFDFQAKGLYEKLGYTVFGILKDCPEGHNRYYMSKNLIIK